MFEDAGCFETENGDVKTSQLVLTIKMYRIKTTTKIHNMKKKVGWCYYLVTIISAQKGSKNLNITTLDFPLCLKLSYKTSPRQLLRGQTPEQKTPLPEGRIHFYSGH